MIRKPRLGLRQGFGRPPILTLAVALLLLTCTVGPVLAYYPPLPGVTASKNGTTVTYSVYDPNKGQTVTGTWSGSSYNFDYVDHLVCVDNVVAWRAQDATSDMWQVHFRTYDPKKGSWQGGSSTKDWAAIDCDLVCDDGVVVWMLMDGISYPGTYWHGWQGCATYDPDNSNGIWVEWERSFSSITAVPGTPLTTKDGIAAFNLGTGASWNLTANIYYGVYDPDDRQWRVGDTHPTGYDTLLPSISISQATVFWGTSKRGYNSPSHVWSTSMNTKPLAAYRVQPTSGTPPLKCWFTDMSIGANSWYWEFGDGSTHSGRILPSPYYHTYTSPGHFPSRQTVTGFNGESDSSDYQIIDTDSSPPANCSVAIRSLEDDTQYTRSLNVNLTLSATDNSGTVAEMRLSNNGTTWNAWEPYATSKAWTLASGLDGTRYVYAQFRDAGQHTSSSVSDSIILDTTAPTCSLSINNGAATTTTTAVTLNMSVSGATQMRFSNDNSTWSTWETYASTKAWILTSGDGTKTVYGQFRDAAGNVCSDDDSITLDTTAPTCGISVNNGAVYATTTTATLNLSSTGASQMRFSNDNSTWSTWETYAATKAWTLTSVDGPKTVYAQFRDAAGNTTNCNDSITLDTTAPTGTVSINSGTTYTTTTAVTLTLSASDATSGVAQMRFSNDGTNWSTWEAYATNKSWTLTSSDGPKTVYVQFKDNAGLVSANAMDQITLDTVGPTCNISINGGAQYTNSTSVTLNLSPTDATSGVCEMRFSSDCTNWGAWIPYQPTSSWTLASGDGTKTVCVQFRDCAGNIGSSCSDTIILDTVAPTGSITINGGDTYTKSTTVTLTLSATGAAYMQFSNDGTNWSTWEAYATSKSWTLTSGDGTKTVYVRFKDAAENISSPYSDTIILDTTAPTCSITINNGAAYTSTTSVTLTLSSSDSGSGVYQMRFSNDGTNWSAWEAYATTKSWTLSSGDGQKTVYVQFKDRAGSGNISTGCGDSILLDTTAPTGSLLIEGGAEYTTSTECILTTSADDGSGSGVSERRLSSDNLNWSPWEVYSYDRAWIVDYGEGEKVVYVQYKDNAGNLSAVYSDTIILDATPPWCAFTVNNGDAYTGSVSVTLNLTPEDTTSGMDAMRFSNDNLDWSEWQSCGPTASWTLTSGDGEKTVYTQFRDNAGNVSTACTDTIVLDTAVPTGSMVINNGDTYATSTLVNLTLSAADTGGSGVTQMRFSNDGSTWSTWEAYATSATWTLDSANGEKTVYAQFRDAAGNVSTDCTDTVILDTVAPTVIPVNPVIDDVAVLLDTTVTATFSEAVQTGSINDQSFTLTDSAANPVTGSVTFESGTATFTPASNLELDTVYTAKLTAGVCDLAGNPLANDYAWSFRTVANLGVARKQIDHTYAGVGPMVVTGVFNHTAPAHNWVYVQTMDRLAGIRVDTTSTDFAVGQRVRVYGELKSDTDPNGEKYIDTTATGGFMTILSGTASASPLGMRNSWIAGQRPATTLPAVTNGFGFYNVGMLVQSWGRVAWLGTDIHGDYFLITDGSGLRVIVPSGVTRPSVGDYVRVTGVCGVIKIPTTTWYVPAIRVRTASDIQYIESESLSINLWQPWQTDGAAGVPLVVGRNTLTMPGIPRTCDPAGVFVASPGYSAINVEGMLSKFDPLQMAWMGYYANCDGIVSIGPAQVADAFRLQIPDDGQTYRYACDGTPVTGDQLVSLPLGDPSTRYYYSIFGNPFDADVAWANCKITDGITWAYMTDAVGSWVYDVYEWNQSTYKWDKINDVLSTKSLHGRGTYTIMPKAGSLALIIPQPTP